MIPIVGLNMQKREETMNFIVGTMKCVENNKET